MNFDEWNKETDSLCPRRAFEAGAQSQQAKIGILQIKLNGADERAAAVLNHKNKMIDELQAKIDEINEVANGWKDEYRIMSLRYERSKKRINELQIKIAFQEKAIKNIKLQFENKQIDCDRSDREINELQARVDEVLIEMKNQLGDEDYYDMERPDYDAMLYALRNIKDILIK